MEGWLFKFEMNAVEEYNFSMLYGEEYNFSVMYIVLQMFYLVGVLWHVSYRFSKCEPFNYSESECLIDGVMVVYKWNECYAAEECNFSLLYIVQRYYICLASCWSFLIDFHTVNLCYPRIGCLIVGVMIILKVKWMLH